MPRFSIALVLSAIALLFFVPTQVRADSLNFTFSESSVDYGTTITISWSLPATPDPTAPDFSATPGVGFSVADIPATLSAGALIIPGSDTFNFNFASSGIVFEDFLGFQLAGVPTLFSGTENNPTFIPGAYSGFDPSSLDLNGAPDPATLTISTPEPSSALMLCLGFLLVAGALFVKKAAV
ncbi:MAG TPA: hypothetical protein VMJ35_00660 [Dongiaceae bacterium]|nr:hypothetical protein [Dongiaceae bacterium]